MKRRAAVVRSGARIINSWNFPEGRFMKCVATHLYDRKLRGHALLSAFQKFVPHWKEYFDKPISDDAVVQRADKARRYANENPETNPRLKRYWRPAGAIVRRGRRLTKQTINAIVRKCEPEPGNGGVGTAIKLARVTLSSHT
jgi:hypothetical protein